MQTEGDKGMATMAGKEIKIELSTMISAAALIAVIIIPIMGWSNNSEQAVYEVDKRLRVMESRAETYPAASELATTKAEVKALASDVNEIKTDVRWLREHFQDGNNSRDLNRN